MRRKVKTNFKPVKKRPIPADFPAHRYIDLLMKNEKDGNKDGVNPALDHHKALVQAFILLHQAHEYIYDARRELETILGVRLCQENCCCTRTVPFVTALEAEYIISETGYYSDLLRISEEWLLQDHPEAPTKPEHLPGMVGGSFKAMPAIGQEFKAIAHTRSPFLLAGENHVERLTVGPYVKTSYADGSAVSHGQAWDLLEHTQPLTCAVAGVFKAPNPWCRRQPGIGESGDARVLADPSSVKRYVGALNRIYDKYPDKGQWGLLPAMIMRIANPVRFDEIVTQGKVALAKLGLSRGERFPFALWEERYVGTAQGRITSSSTGATGGTRGR